MPANYSQRPTGAFIGASWAALLVGATTYLVGLWNAQMQLNEKGFYAMSFVLCQFAAVAVQKNVREVALSNDRESGDTVPGA